MRILVTGGAGFIGSHYVEATVRWYAGNRSWWEPLKRPSAAPAPAGSGRAS